MSGHSGSSAGRLKRDLGTLESYAALLGILVGAGIFRVTSDAYALTGPSVILGHLVLAAAILATSVSYMVYLSTPLGRQPGGEYTHVAHTFGDKRIAFVGAWLKLISYLGAGAFLSIVLADYLIELEGMLSGLLDAESHRLPVALAAWTFFYVVHVVGVRWFGRLQVAMCAVLGISIAVLVVPGLFAVDLDNYRPFFTGGVGGFTAALPPLFFAYAGFESVAHAAGEVQDSTRRLPRIFLRGILVTAAVFISMSIVSFGVLPGAALAESTTPMADVAARYLPAGATALVAVGGVMAVATSLNASLFVPARLAMIVAKDGLLPRALSSVHATTGTPVVGLTATFLLGGALLISGQVNLALNIAIFALTILYLLHSVAHWLLPRLNPELHRSETSGVSLRVQRIAAGTSILLMGSLVVVQIVADVRSIMSTSIAERFQADSSTSLELLVVWGAVGALVYGAVRSRPSTA